MNDLSPSKGRQQGVAVITAMLLIALGTITMVSITAKQQLDLQRERNEAVIQQARAFGVSGERFAAALLYRDVQAGLRENTDSLDDDWAQTIPPIPIDNASIQGCIVDMQGRFNLNNVINLDGEVQAFYAGQLRRLLSELNIDVTKADAIIDWLDKDINATIPDGAEDDYYTGLENGYRTANAPMVSVSELQLVKGFGTVMKEEQEDFELLLPHVAALPITRGPTPVNVNTATPEVLASLSDEVKPLAADLSRWETGAYEDYPLCENIFDLTADDGPDVLDANRDLTPYESTLIFAQAVDAADTGNDVADDPNSFDVRSNYFQVRIDVEAEGIKLSQFTLFERNDEGKNTSHLSLTRYLVTTGTIVSKHVIIYLPVVGDETAFWAVSDDKGNLTTSVEQGNLSMAAASVDGRKVTLIIPADEVLLAQVQVPGNSLAKAQQAIPYALEEQVADDVDTLHFAVGQRGTNDSYPVAVVSIDIMDKLSLICQEVGLRPTQILPETLALPVLDGTTDEIQAWTALLDNGQVVVRLGDYQGFAADAAMSSIMLEGADTESGNELTKALVVFNTNLASPLAVPSAIQSEERHCDHRMALYASGLANSPVINLLQGRYNPKRHFDKTWQPWRWSAALVACVCLLVFVGKWFDVRQLEQQEAYLDAQIAEAFKQALPEARMQRPRRQIQSALSRLGDGNSDGFTHRLAQIAQSLATQPQTQLRTMGYRNGRFDLDLTTDAVPTLDALKSELAKRGSLTMTVQSANRENEGVRGRVRIE